MPTTTTHVETSAVSDLVEEYVSKALFNAEKYDNSEPLDEDGIYRLHVLAAEIYAMGYETGQFVTIERERHARQRARDRQELAEHKKKLAAALANNQV